MIETSKLTTRGLYRRALRIHRDPSAPQDIDILCPIYADGMWCQWVAGHYGGCVLGRANRQMGRDRR